MFSASFGVDRFDALDRLAIGSSLMLRYADIHTRTYVYASRALFLGLDEAVHVGAVEQQLPAEIDAWEPPLPLEVAHAPRADPKVGGGLVQGQQTARSVGGRLPPSSRASAGGKRRGLFILAPGRRASWFTRTSGTSVPEPCPFLGAVVSGCSAPRPRRGELRRQHARRAHQGLPDTGHA